MFPRRVADRVLGVVGGSAPRDKKTLNMCYNQNIRVVWRGQWLRLRSEYTMPHFRRFAGTLIVVPLVALFLGGTWAWDQSVRFDNALLLDESLPGHQVRDRADPVVPFHFPDAVDWTYGTVIESGQAFEVSLPAPVGQFAI